jgi:hypothetical protein
MEMICTTVLHNQLANHSLLQLLFCSELETEKISTPSIRTFSLKMNVKPLEPNHFCA